MKKQMHTLRTIVKKCPCCRATVQKLQTEEQERHEKITGLAGGTQEVSSCNLWCM